MYTIVVATDFSKCANNAMTYALELSLRIKAKIRVVHVVYPNQGIDNSIYNAFWIDDYLALRNKDMRAWVAKFKKKPAFKDAQVEHHCEVGFTAPTIATFAEDHKADLIIVGTTGSTGLSTNLLGSVASGVISNVKIPVLAVPKDSTFDGAYDIAMATDMRIHLNNKSKDILRELSEGTKSPLHLIHILDKPGAMPDNSKEGSIKQELTPINLAFHYINNAEISNAIRDFVATHSITMLVTVAHQHGLMHRLFMRSVSKELISSIAMPVLVLYEN